jgi:EAL domain-containing protein (putative c-di-GMP-specific phosphodiesterase class I)
MSEPGSVSQEHYLVEIAQRLDGGPSDRIAVQLHLSKLRPENRLPAHQRIMTMLLMPLVERRQGQLFPLSNGDIFLILRAPEDNEIEDLLDRIRYLFAEDPLTEGDPADEPGRVATWYDLGQDHALFRTVVERLQARARQQAAQSANETRPRQEPRGLTARNLPQLLYALEKTDVGPAVRREAVCVVMPDTPPRPIFWEAKVDLDEICRAMAPGSTLELGRWLRLALEEKMLERLLTWLSRRDLTESSQSISIDATIAGLLSDSFLALDSNIGAKARNRIFFEIADLDALGNLGQLAFLTGMLHERGYHVVLDRLNHLTLPLVDRELLGFDFLKLAWGADFETDIRADRTRSLVAAIEAAGRARIILHNCDSARALDFGRELGLTLFQGSYVDRLLKTSTESAEPPTARSA